VTVTDGNSTVTGGNRRYINRHWQ